MKKLFTLLFLLIACRLTHAQPTPDKIYMPNITTPMLYPLDNPTSVPIIQLNSQDQLELHFDDMDAEVKSYYYTYQLCNADWQPANLSTFDFIKGFQQQRITQFRASSSTLSQYIHYQAVIPQTNCFPTKSGNYLLKVFINGDTANLAFTKRLYILQSKAVISGSITHPYNTDQFLTHQRLQFTCNMGTLNVLSPQQQLKIVVLENNRLDNMVQNVPPTFIRGNVYEYNDDNFGVFPGGKEYRWADLRSYRFASERVASIDKDSQPISVNMVVDGDLNKQRYLYYRDLNSWYFTSATENINPYSQSDYAMVTFRYMPPNRQPYPYKEVYLSGGLTGNALGDSALMHFDASRGVYEKKLLLKQGFYSYCYLTKDVRDRESLATPTLTEGDYWETENDFHVFVYYRDFSGRHDELIGFVTLNSRVNRYGQ